MSKKRRISIYEVRYLGSVIGHVEAKDKRDALITVREQMAFDWDNPFEQVFVDFDLDNYNPVYGSKDETFAGHSNLYNEDDVEELLRDSNMLMVKVKRTRLTEIPEPLDDED